MALNPDATFSKEIHLRSSSQEGEPTAGKKSHINPVTRTGKEH
jgi:hypothetical protein